MQTAVMAEYTKRARGNPTGVTPTQPAKRRVSSRSSQVSSTSKRQLFPSDPSVQDDKSSRAAGWSASEKRLLVDYIEDVGDGKNWVFSKRVSTWEKASVFLNERSGILRTSEHCALLLYNSYTM